jgi:hypothetical protein
LIAACSDEIPVQLFNVKENGAIMKDYSYLNKSSYTVDVSKDNGSFLMGDDTGRVIVEKLN